MKCDHDDYKIECFEIGRGLWHARIRRADLRPVILDGVLLSALEVGFAWSDPDDAISHARAQIDRFKKRCLPAAPPQAELSAAN